MQSTLFAVIFSILITGLLTACKQDAPVDSQDIDAQVTQSDTQTKVNNSAEVEKAAAKNDFSDVKALYQSMIGETDDISKVVNNTTDIAFADLSTPTDTRITGFSTKYDNFGFFKGHLSNIIRYDMELTYLTSETDIEKLYVRFRDDLINYDSSLTEKKSIRRDKGEYKEVVGQIRNDSDNYFFTISRDPDQATVFNLTFTRSATYKIFNGVPFATGGMTALPQDEYYVINFRGRQRE